MPQRYPIGTSYLGKQRRLTVIVDFWTTRNLAGEIVRECYVTEHDFLGQKILDYNVPEATIARNLPRPGTN